MVKEERGKAWKKNCRGKRSCVLIAFKFVELWGKCLTLLQGLTSQMVSLSSAWKCLGSESLGNGFTKSSAAIFFFYDVSTNFQGLPLPELYWKFLKFAWSHYLRGFLRIEVVLQG